MKAFGSVLLLLIQLIPLPLHERISVRRFDVLILGAGAAGLMCAVEAGRRGRKVLVVDHGDRVGKKILISGGGRCNFTNLHCSAENFLSENPHFARSALARFPPSEMIALVERHRVPYHEKALGQLFCDRTARDITDLFADECAQARVQIEVGVSVGAIREHEKGFTLETSHGILATDSLVVATGGLSIPKIGATGFGYELARQFGLRVIACRPGLTPLTFEAADRDRWCDLSGSSAEVLASLGTLASGVLASKPDSRSGRPPGFREKLLITHRGISGPAALQISSFWEPGTTLQFDLAPGRKVLDPILAPNASRDAAAILTAVRTVLPTRWAERWLRENLPDPMPRQLSNAAIVSLEARLHAWQVTPAGTEGYMKAEVTAGGVATDELDPRTLESRKIPKLFFIGEVVDVTGWLGGYNFQWAWASGFCAGQVC